MGALPLFLWEDRREVLPSIGAPPPGVPVNQATQETNERWNRSASPSVECGENIPKVIMRRCSVAKGTEPAHQLNLPITE